MIIGATFYGDDMEGNIYDTAIPTGSMDQIVVGGGIYDEIYMTLDPEQAGITVKPTKWNVKTIMDAKFEKTLEAGTISGGDRFVTEMQLYRREYTKKDAEWLLIGDWPYDPTYNIYSFVDRFTENGVMYQYALVPVAGSVIGDKTESNPVTSTFEGVWISDSEANYHMEVDFDGGEVKYNKNSATMTPLDGKYPVVTFGNQNYRSGAIKFLPLGRSQIDGINPDIDGREELKNRQEIVDFLNNGEPKAIRYDTGDVLAVATDTVTATPMAGRLRDLQTISFNYTEIGDLSANGLKTNGFVGVAGRSNYSFDDYGNPVNYNRINTEARKVKLYGQD